MMTVWIVNPFDNLPSEGNRPQRYWLMAEAFVRAGHRVVYWTSDFSHATKKKRVVVGSCSGSGDGIDIVEIPTLPYAKNICWARVKSHQKLARDFTCLATQTISTCSPQLIIASVPPLGLCEDAMRIARRCGATFICDIQDAWPETFERVLPSWVWTALGMRRTATRIYCGSDGVSAVAKRYVELAKSRGSVAPMHVAGHAIDMSRGESTGRVGVERGDDLRIVYAGNMSMSYDLETVIQAVRDLPNVTLDIAGNGPDLNRLKKLSTSSTLLHGRNNIRFHGYLGEKELSDLLRSCNIGIIPMFPESCVGVPGKLADYAAAGLRIIESLGGECQQIVEQYGVGVHYTAGDIASLKQAISRLASNLQPHPQLSTLNPQPTPTSSSFAAHFDAHKIMDDYVSWCEEVVK